MSLAYHPETNTISPEPVIVENIPSIATQLTGYEVIEKSILHEPKTRRPDQFLIYEPVVSKTMDISNTMEAEQAVVQSTNVLNLSQEETNKTVAEAKIKHASHTIEKKVKFKLNEEIESSSSETNSEEVSEQFISKCKKVASSGEIQGLSENGITANSNANCLAEENVSLKTTFLSLVPNYLSEASTVEDTEIATCIDKTINKISPVTEESKIIQKKENNFYNPLEIEHEAKSVDEEVEDLCEREFNELSLEYEKIHKPEVKKPAAQVVGAVPIFLGVDFSTLKRTEEPDRQIEKKLSRKPGSLVPGAKPLFGNTIGDIHVSMNESDGPDRPYEKIPVKSLISTFEQSTRPLIKYKQMQDKIPDAVSPNKFLNKEIQYEQKRGNDQQRSDKEQTNFYSVENVTQNCYTSENNVNTFEKYTVKDNTDNFDEEEIKRIEHHYELQKHKKEIYDQQMQKYKEEMKKLHTKKTQSTEKSEQSTSIRQEKQIFTSKSSDVKQTQFLSNGTYYDGGQSNVILRSELFKNNMLFCFLF